MVSSKRLFVRRIVPAACGVLLAAAAAAQAPPALPLQNLGLEHLDIIVPDTEASARFYARVFKTVLHQQPLQGGLRYFVLLGDLPADRQVGYLAIGAEQEESRRSAITIVVELRIAG